MATYYVKTGGNDNADGLSDGNAWATIGKVNDQSFSPGDNIYFNKGDVWRIVDDERLYPTDSGTSGNVITFGAYGSGSLPQFLGSIAKNSTGDWTDEGGNLWYASSSGIVDMVIYDSEASFATMVSLKGSLNVQGEAWFDDPNNRIYVYSVGNPATVYNGVIECSRADEAIYCANQSYITFEYLDCRYYGDDIVEIRRGDGETDSHIIMDHCVVKFAGGNLDNVRAGIIIRRIPNVTISYCTVEYWWAGIYATAVEQETMLNITLTYNTIAHAIGLISSGDAIVLQYYDYTGTVISHNDISDFYDDGIDMVGASNIVFEYNEIYSPKSNEGEGNGIKMGLNHANTNNIVRYNYVHDLDTGYGKSGIMTNGASDSYIYYNIIANVDGVGIMNNRFQADHMGKDNYIYNNIIYNVGGHAITCGSPSYAINMTIRNNICDSVGSGKSDLHTGNSNVTVTGGYNCLVNDGSVGGSGSYNGSANDLYGTDPLLVDPANEDFELQSSSSCIDVGVDVSLSEDYDGTVVPQGANPDIGAQEYGYSPTGSTIISPAAISVTSSIPSPILVQTEAGGAEGWLTGWGYRKKITVQSANISNDLTDFPVYVDITTDSDIGGNVSDTTNGYDIRFTDADGETLLKYERTYFNVSAGDATGHYFVKVPTSYASPTGTQNEIYIYYNDDDGSVDGEDADNTWRAEYKGVWHMDAASGNEADSSGNSNTLTENGTVASTAGKIHNCRDYESAGSDQYHTIVDGSQTGLNITGDISFSYWINLESLLVNQFVCGKHWAGGGGNYSYMMRIDSGNVVECAYSDDGDNVSVIQTSSGIMTGEDGNWVHLAGVVDVSATTGTIYKNGAAQSMASPSGSESAIYDGSAPFSIGVQDTGEGFWLDGKVDEVRIYSGLYPTGWIAFEHANMNEGDNELDWGSEEASSVDITTTPAAMEVVANLLVPAITAVDNTVDFGFDATTFSITATLLAPSVSIGVNPTSGTDLAMDMEL